MSYELLAVLTPPSIDQPDITPAGGLVVPSAWTLDLSPSPDASLPAPVVSTEDYYLTPANGATEERVMGILAYLRIPLTGPIREDWETQWRLGYMNLGKDELENKEVFAAWHAARTILGETSYRQRREGVAQVGDSKYWPNRVAARTAAAISAATEPTSDPFPENAPGRPARRFFIARFIGRGVTPANAQPAIEAAPRSAPAKHQK